MSCRIRQILLTYQFLTPNPSPIINGSRVSRPSRIHGKPCATYESASTRKFKGGRTETIRSCSAESLAFYRAMLESRASRSAKVEALANAINAHKEYARDVRRVNSAGMWEQEATRWMEMA